jgi:hypothetical protein
MMPTRGAARATPAGDGPNAEQRAQSAAQTQTPTACCLIISAAGDSVETQALFVTSAL